MSQYPVSKRLALDAMATVYTVPAGRYAMVSHLQITPIDLDNEVDVTVQWLDASDSDAITPLCQGETIKPNDTGPIYPMGGTLILSAGDQVQAEASTVGDAVLSFSALEYDV
ncbi:hypothetical protein [Phaeobacter inhibens]|uniref:hypothetical protein n=1 Tax=Phaeobacter inhibens TaxID=221822 RepID=UPI000C9A7153|nr:hypothetical protein [Phaeobacter inhibens]AUQ71028.1 hypothetical protein PhaeoP54_02149 [Phaeobacter inhibens]